MNDKEQVQEKAKGISIGLLIVFAVLAALVILFAIITQEIVIEKESGFDSAVAAFVSRFRSPTATTIMEFITFFGSRMFLLPAYILIVVYLLFFRKRSRDSIGVAAVALCGAGMLMLLKNIFRRARPSDALIQKITSFSYPSGHSFSAFTFAGIVAYLVWNSSLKRSYKWIISLLLFLFALMIAFSRIYLHVHYASDVLAGFCVSLLWLSASYYVLKRLRLIQG